MCQRLNKEPLFAISALCTVLTNRYNQMEFYHCFGFNTITSFLSKGSVLAPAIMKYCLNLLLLCSRNGSNSLWIIPTPTEALSLKLLKLQDFTTALLKLLQYGDISYETKAEVVHILENWSSYSMPVNWMCSLISRVSSIAPVFENSGLPLSFLAAQQDSINCS